MWLRYAAGRHDTHHEGEIHLETMISALGVLADNADMRDDGQRDLAVRAAALDAAIAHLAGDGSRVADSKGDGNAVVGCARTFERYLTDPDSGSQADDSEVFEAGLAELCEARDLLATAAFGELGDADGWAARRDRLIASLDQALAAVDTPAGGR